ncbi:class F sortase [Amycolatopsis magusensis]|uniref:class F sortase n=1 Tax=Amycolatopsis magusensis TaxID=882444 RepID=UPI0037BACA26
MPADPRWRPALVVLIGLLLAVTGCTAGAAGPPPAEPAVSAPAGGAEPESIDIPKIGARSSLVGLGLNPDDTVEVPPVTQPLQAGWYVHGPKPGEPGPAVVLGHVDGNHQPGIFFRLKELAVGDEITVRRTDGSAVAFVVREVDQVAKKNFPTDRVYGDTEGAELRLITCGGVFDSTARSYQDNVIVYATLTGSSR